MKPSGRRNIAPASGAFISHYVQMKRRKRADAAHLHVLYIPLRSDETFFIKFTNNRFNCLYIPLRSDETEPGARQQHGAPVFISHYVQMKRWR